MAVFLEMALPRSATSLCAVVLNGGVGVMLNVIEGRFVRYRRVVLLPVAVAIAPVVLMLTGCGAPKDSPGVATAQGQTSASATPSASASAPATDYDKALRFARCFNAEREKHAAEYVRYGMGPMPDPVVGKHLAIPGTQGPAWENCKSLLPATWPVKMDPKEVERDRAFGDCLRKRGVYWPEDPDANGNMNYSSDPEYLDAPSVKPAVAACQHLLDDPAVKARSRGNGG
jgi:hypothetical protein